ncbi:MAG: PQQ-dependent sugar dehydrogenase [Gemmatimonadota bacterium]|uniref:Glucose/Sorbosone dehydrogenase domain-containing protein n=1 Tax=marine metagenome TaxID=408172 RepID=A0A382D4G7_9ZZZZ|nr:PQQ-dependent sugar dehydrogenase [Gemmatimonadota bacterium]
MRFLGVRIFLALLDFGYAAKVESHPEGIIRLRFRDNLKEKLHRIALAGAISAVATVNPLTAQVEPELEVYESARHNFRVVTVAEDLDHPWSIAWLPSGEMLITERPGRVRIIRDGVLDPNPIMGWPAAYRQQGQGGFMDVVPHPDFATNRLLYLSYGKPSEDTSTGTTTVVRGRLEVDHVEDIKEIFEANAWGDNNNHFSGRMVFDHDGYLFLTVGDRMLDPDLLVDHPAQDRTNHMGTIVRLHDDGRVPQDNPFVDRNDALAEIWSYGHRNLQGLTVHPTTGEIWSNEHGPRGGDELNLIVPGQNYGWPVVSHGIHYDGRIITMDEERQGMESPRFVWVPSIGTSGLMFYSGDQFPWWKGNVFVGGMVGERLVRVTLSDGFAMGEETLLHGVLGRVRDVREGPDGFIYLVIEAEQGGTPLSDVVRLEPVAGDVALPR